MDVVQLEAESLSLQTKRLQMRVLATLLVCMLQTAHLCSSQGHRDRRGVDPQVLSYPSLTLVMVTNSTLNCGTGLTHPGVLVLVEYRLAVGGKTPGEWQLLDTVTMEPTGQVP